MLLDTYSWVEYFNGTKKGSTVRGLLFSNACFTSSISIAELSEWAEKNKLDSKKYINQVVKLSSIIPLSEELLELSGKIKVQKTKTIKGIGLIDSIILTTGLLYNLPIVTGDKHFKNEKTTIFLN